MNTLHKKLNNINSNHNIIKTKLPLDTSTLDTPYISDKILSKIDWQYDTFIISYNNKNQIIIHTNSKLSKKLIKNMIKIKKFMKNDKILHINLFLTDDIKQLDYSKNEIGPHEVNSGCTTHFLNEPDKNGKIFIWRKEELEKVLIHEMLHSFQLDLHGDAKSEGHIEAMTVLFKLILKNKNYKNMVKDLAKQNKHFDKQMNKLLNYINNDTKITTHIQEYYFDKAYILKEPDKFVEYLNKNNNRFNELEYEELLIANKTNIKKTKIKGKRLRMML